MHKWRQRITTAKAIKENNNIATLPIAIGENIGKTFTVNHKVGAVPEREEEGVCSHGKRVKPTHLHLNLQQKPLNGVVARPPRRNSNYIMQKKQQQQQN